MAETSTVEPACEDEHGEPEVKVNRTTYRVDADVLARAEADPVLVAFGGGDGVDDSSERVQEYWMDASVTFADRVGAAHTGGEEREEREESGGAGKHDRTSGGEREWVNVRRSV
jgi:hypothetical protein